MDSSFLQIIAEACSSARRQGLSAMETREAVQAALMARDPTLRPGAARVLAEQLFPLVEHTMGH